MSQDEYRDALPGHVDFEPARTEPVNSVNGRRPVPARHKPDGVSRRRADPVDVWDQRVANGLAFLRRRLAGAYEVDDFGFDPELTDAVFHPLLRLLYHDWFRTEVFGIEH